MNPLPAYLEVFWHYNKDSCPRMYTLCTVIKGKLVALAHFTVVGGGSFELIYFWPQTSDITFIDDSTVAEVKDRIICQLYEETNLDTSFVELSKAKTKKMFLRFAKAAVFGDT